MIGPLVEARATGQTVVVDAFDARLHTVLARQIVELLGDPLVDQHNAQLIFVSHDTNLITRSLLRRDQLCQSPPRCPRARPTHGEGGRRVATDHPMAQPAWEGRVGAHTEAQRAGRGAAL